jgi:hypothetical protein
MKSIAVPVVRRPTAARPRKAGHPQTPPQDHVVGGKVGAPRPATAPVQSAKHRYHVGQRLRLAGGGSAWTRASGSCKVTALLPHESGPFLYRVRSEAESFERVVAEVDLALAELS